MENSSGVQLPKPEDVKTVGILGTGVIGGGWALHFLRHGLDVVIFDPGKGAEAAMEKMVADTWPTLEKLGLKNSASQNNLKFVDSMADMAAAAQVIQENIPENLELKQNVYQELDSLADPSVVLLSSTSGFAMTDMQRFCIHNPGRTVVGHPFNPPYLIPFVEVVGGEKSDPDTVEWAAQFYKIFGKYPIKMEKEVSGFIANRLQEAMWREALHMVAQGEASVKDIDDSITYGPGLRWAVMGPCLTFHLAGGKGGMGHMLDHFGPSLEEPWTRLKAPELTKELRDAMVQGCEREANGRTVSQLVKERDDCLIEIMAVLDKYKKKSENND